MTTIPGNKPGFESTRRIRMAETDSSGYAHFATYVRLMEETEYAFLRSRELCVVLNDGRGTIGFPRLSVNIDVQNPARFDQFACTKLELAENDGKQITYNFTIVDASVDSNHGAPHHSPPIAAGTFVVACCRFPDDAPPYAILTPEFVMSALENPPA